MTSTPILAPSSPSPGAPDFVLNLPVSPTQKKQLQGGQFVLVDATDATALGMTHAPYGTILPVDAVLVPNGLERSSSNASAPVSPGKNRVTVVCRSPVKSDDEGDEIGGIRSRKVSLPPPPVSPTSIGRPDSNLAQLTPNLYADTEEMAKLTQALPPLHSPVIYCCIEFKRGRTELYTSPNYLERGEYVIVEGDRGEDLGMVENTWISAAPVLDPAVFAATPLEHAGEITEYDNQEGEHLVSHGPEQEDGQEIKKVIRRATAEEIKRLHTDHADEERKRVEHCKQLIPDFGVQMELVDAELQFDRKKLTFFYEAEERQDFRMLCRELYKHYHQRIWFHKVNPDLTKRVGRFAGGARGAEDSSAPPPSPPATAKGWAPPSPSQARGPPTRTGPVKENTSSPANRVGAPRTSAPPSPSKSNAPST